MTEIKFSGSAIVTGFPREKAFGFEVEGDSLIIKAGKEVFLTIQKEQLFIAEYKHVEVSAAAASAIVAPQVAEPSKQAPATSSIADVVQRTEAAQHAANPKEVEAPDEKTRKPRSPNVVIDEGNLIAIDPNRANPYSKLRGKYYETLKTAQGRTVAWWKETSMVKGLEGSPVTMLKFFLSEGTLQLHPANGGPVTAPQTVVPIQPSFGGVPAQQAAQVAGPLWSPQTPAGTPAPSQGGGTGPTFM